MPALKSVIGICHFYSAYSNRNLLILPHLQKTDCFFYLCRYFIAIVFVCKRSDLHISSEVEQQLLQNPKHGILSCIAVSCKILPADFIKLFYCYSIHFFFLSLKEQVPGKSYKFSFPTTSSKFFVMTVFSNNSSKNDAL